MRIKMEVRTKTIKTRMMINNRNKGMKTIKIRMKMPTNRIKTKIRQYPHSNPSANNSPSEI